MMKIINESVQMIHLGPTDKLTIDVINNALHAARIGYTYARFYTNNVFIQVNYMRDGTISVSSNIRSMPFLVDYRRQESYGWTEGRVKLFVYQWMQVCRQNLY